MSASHRRLLLRWLRRSLWLASVSFSSLFCSCFSWLHFHWQLDNEDVCCSTCGDQLDFCLFCWIGVRRALHFVLSHKRKPTGNARHDIAHQLQRRCLWLVWTMQLWHHVGRWTCNRANANGQNLQRLPARCFYLFRLTILFPWQTNHQTLFWRWFWVCICQNMFDYEDDVRRV